MAATQKEIEALISLYTAARERLLDTIIHYPGVGTKTYANTILHQLQRELKKLEAGSGAFAASAIPRAYRDSLKATYNYFKRNKLRMRSPSAFAAIHTDAMHTLAREMQYAIGQGLAQVGRQVRRYVDSTRDEALRQAGLRQSGIKIASGGTVADMRNALLKELQENGFMTVQYGQGKHARQVPVDVYAAMVARSTTREAGNTARLNQLTANGYDLVKVTEHTPTCAVCAALQGRVYSISGHDTRFPPLSRAFRNPQYHNIHPNCRHVATPWVEELREPDELAQAIKDSNRPFGDPRGGEEKALYDRQQRDNRQARQEMYQYERYKERLGDDAPKSLAAFRRMKNAGGEMWDALQERYRAAGLKLNEKGGILQSQGDGLMKVTDQSVANVPVVESDVLPRQYWGTLHEKHRELLEYVRDDAPGTEAVAYYDLDMRELTRYKGPEGGGYVKGTSMGTPHIVIHNHPDGRTFTHSDVRRLTANPSTKMLTAVGNNGSLFALEKTEDFDVDSVDRLLAHESLKRDKYMASPETFESMMLDFLRSLSVYGLTYVERRP